MIGLTPAQAADLEVAYPAGGVPSVDADIRRCQTISAAEADERLACWIDFDKKLMEQVVPLVPLMWDLATVVSAPSLTRYVFDQATGEISMTQIAVGNKQRLP
jgi:hypothetical protein